MAINIFVRVEPYNSKEYSMDSSNDISVSSRRDV